MGDYKRMLIIGGGAVVILLALRRLHKQGKSSQSCRPVQVRVESFEAGNTPPPLGEAASKRTMVTSLPPLAESQIGVPDRAASSPVAADTRPAIEIAAGAPVGYDSMFDTQTRPAWLTGKPHATDDKPVSIPATKAAAGDLTIVGKRPANCKGCGDGAGEEKRLFEIDSRGLPRFSNLVACNQENYHTSQNFYEYNYKYPLIPGFETVGPLGSNFPNLDQQAAPGIDYRIVGGNLDGGAPMPNGTYFRQ
jgi:hypothetical protein